MLHIMHQSMLCFIWVFYLKMGKKSNTTYAASTNCSVTYFRQIMKVGMPHNDDSTPFKIVTQHGFDPLYFFNHRFSYDWKACLFPFP